MRLRASEVTRLIELLDQEYETDREAATVVFNGVVDLLAMRTSLVVGVKTSVDDPMTLIYGPFWDKRSAAKFCQRTEATGLLARTANQYRPLAPLEAEPSGWCPECAHALQVHAVASKGPPVCFYRGCQPCAPTWPKPRRRPG